SARCSISSGPRAVPRRRRPPCWTCRCGRSNAAGRPPGCVCEALRVEVSPMYPNNLTDLVLLWEEWYEQGVDVPAEELGRDRPDLVAGLRQRIDALKELAWLNQRQDASAAAEEAPAAPDLGQFPHLRLERVIGQGGFARVWSGFHLRLHRPVAVKVFGQGYGHHRTWQESLRQEAER